LLQVVEIHDSTPDKKRKSLEYRYHLLQVRAESIDIDSVDATNLDAYDSPRLFMRAGQLVCLDTFLCTHGQSGRLYGACFVYFCLAYGKNEGCDQLPACTHDPNKMILHPPAAVDLT
jgi:hypothetical protein